MPKRSTQSGDYIIHDYDLAAEVMQLDLTSDRWALQDGQASVVLGLDVTAPGTTRPDRGRRPVGCVLPADSGSVTSACGSLRRHRVSTRYRDMAENGTTWVNAALVTTYYDDTGNAQGEHAVYKANAFTTYTWQLGDLVYLVPADTDYAHQIGLYEVASKPSDHAILLAESAGSDIPFGTFGIYIFRRHARGYWVYDAGKLAKTPREYEITGPWPAAMVGAYIHKNSDGRRLAAEFRQINARSRTMNENDTIEWVWDFLTIWDANGYDKFSIVYTQERDLRGVWVTNGRKFWLVQNGAYTLYLDLDDDEYLGLEWEFANIKNNLLMLTNPTVPPRVIHLDETGVTEGRDGHSLAGTVAPRKSLSHESNGTNDGDEQKTWWGAESAPADGGLIPPAEYRGLVRAVNYDDDGESSFVPVFDYADKDDQTIEVTAGKTAIRVYENDHTVAAVGLHGVQALLVQDRWTHLEFWRTQNRGDDYYFERAVELARTYPHERRVSGTDIGPLAMVEQLPDVASQTIFYYSDATLTNNPQATDNDLDAGGVPPICQQAISLQGVTICAGKADADATAAATLDLKAYGVCADTLTASYYDHGGPYHVVGYQPNVGAAAAFTGYVYADGDLFEITRSEEGVTGVYEIASGAVGTLTLKATSNPGQSLTNVIGFIRRPHTIDWPTIDTDEEIWYSRTDKSAPESFPTRVIELSTTGDTFRRMVRVGNYIAVLMDSGVHLLYFVGGTLSHEAVATSGEGTPWKRSVVVVGNTVVWASAQGPRVMTTSPEANESGNRASVRPLDAEERMTAWFKEAAEQGYEIDAGVDPVNECIRWRRKQDNNTFQSAQHNYRTGRWTLLDDDNGLAFVQSNYVGAEELATPRLYSVTKEGAVLAVNDEGADWPYSTVTVQATLDGTYDVAYTSLRKAGAFDAAMAGDMVRFRSDTATVDGVSRVIRTATASEITFDLVNGLSRGDEYVIGATRFRLRFAAMLGQDDSAVKTLDGLEVVARTGARSAAGLLTARAYRDFGESAQATAELAVPIYDDDEAARTTADRVVADVEVDGRAIEIEVECAEARTDFRLARVGARVKEEGDIRADTSESE